MLKSNGILKTFMNNKNSTIHHIFRKFWIALAILIIIAAVCSSMFRSLTPFVNQYKGEVESHLSQLLGQSVTIKKMETGWYWFEPVLKLSQVTIDDKQNTALHVQKLYIGIDLFKSLIHWSIQPGVLYLDDIHLVLREKEGHWHVDGLSSSAIVEKELNPKRTEELIFWLAQQERLIIKHVSAHLHFENGGLIPVSGLNISIVNHGGYYKLKGQARLEQLNSTSFTLLGQVYFDAKNWDKTSGQIYFSAHHVIPAQWQNLIPNALHKLEGGKGNINLWIDLKQGSISSIQAQIKFKRLAWHFIHTKTRQLVQLFSANLAWKETDTGWEFSADKIQLRIGGVSWPKNQVLVRYNKDQEAYQLFIKSLIIESLLLQSKNLPLPFENWLSLKPHGLLSDTQILIQNKTIRYLLTRFDDLGFKGLYFLPQVENLTGVLNWEPEEGRLELDSEDTEIQWGKYPKKKIPLLNASLEWKQLPSGLRLSLDRLVLSAEDLALTAQGTLDKLSKDSMGYIHLKAAFSGKNMQQWIPYLPKKHIKPKLFAWLSHDVKKIGQATGTISIHGEAKDFPFDKSDGELNLNSHLVGTELKVSKDWPLITDLDGYLRVKGRDMEVHIDNGNFQGVPVQQLNLRINDIGLNKETMLVHGIFKGSAQKMVHFVLASPLKRKLSTLSMLTMKGYLWLNLRLEIPLYPENDDNLAQGELVFNNNKLILKHRVGEFTLEEIKGSLSFDEKGITQSNLIGSAFDSPLNIEVISHKQAQPYTGISINGMCTVDAIKKNFNSPILSYLKGRFAIHSEFKITDNPNDFDSLYIKSDLSGLQVNLPKPLGKQYAIKRPSELQVDFNPTKGLRVRGHYNNQLSADLFFKENKSNINFYSGQVRLGNARALNQNKQGLAIVGSLDGFDVQEWKKLILSNTSDEAGFSLAHKLRIINVSIKSLSFLKQEFNNLVVKAKLLPDNDWSFNLVQKNIAADLRYHLPTNEISGLIHYLHLDKFSKESVTSSTQGMLKPEQIPNLNLRIEDLSIGSIKLGDMTLKTKSTGTRFNLDYCRIESSAYQILIGGDWEQNNHINQTKLWLKMHINDLAGTLKRWEVHPAVDAKKGDLEFKGGWNGTIFDFSLPQLYGSMYLVLKNGRITHLSPETEEKLGLGKLLSILSLQTIPRRLKLDFSDLSQEGYSFDVFKGSFQIRKGSMTTSDSYLDGPVAYASMKGDLDLVKRLYDLDLKISPHITASLPVVATIAGGPIAGIAAWVANKIINQGMQKIIAYSYKISGPWDQPVVQQMSIVKKPKT